MKRGDKFGIRPDGSRLLNNGKQRRRSEREKFAPTILIDGRTVTPKGYEWIMGFALAGCDWALKEANKPEFLVMVRANLKQEKVKQLNKAIQEYKHKIKQCKEEIEAIK